MTRLRIWESIDTSFGCVLLKFFQRFVVIHQEGL